MGELIDHAGIGFEGGDVQSEVDQDVREGARAGPDIGDVVDRSRCTFEQPLNRGARVRGTIRVVVRRRAAKGEAAFFHARSGHGPTVLLASRFTKVASSSRLRLTWAEEVCTTAKAVMSMSKGLHGSGRVSRRTMLTWLAGGIGVVAVAGVTGFELVDHGVLPGKQALDELDGGCDVTSTTLFFAPLGPSL